MAGFEVTAYGRFWVTAEDVVKMILKPKQSGAAEVQSDQIAATRS